MTENRSTVLHNFFLLYMSIFNELVIENDPIKKSNTINTKKQQYCIRNITNTKFQWRL